MPGREGRSWLICFQKRRFSNRRRRPAWPGVPGPPGRGARGSGGEGQGTRPGVPQLSQRHRGREGPRAELLSPGVCTGLGTGQLAGDMAQGRGDRASAAQRDSGAGCG